VFADVARHVLQHEGGPLGLFKGLGATLWRESLGNMAMFGVYELIKQQMVASRGLVSTQQLSHSDLLLAGGLGGTAFWLGCYPVGKHGILQFQVSAARSTLNCKYFLQLSVQMHTHTHLHFAGKVQIIFTSVSMITHRKCVPCCDLLAVLCAMRCVADIIKSKLQVDSYSHPQFRGIVDCGRQIMADQGVKGLYRGFAPALARSFPANAVCFAVYEAVKAAITPAMSEGACWAAAV
jgi:hypothetical protein